MQEGNQRSRLEHRFLREDNPQRAQDSPTEIVRARIRFASSDGFIDLIKPIATVAQGSQGKENE
jgi:hypothetical protein